MLEKWLQEKASPTDSLRKYGLFEIGEHCSILEEVKIHITMLLRDARTDPGLIEKLEKLGWKNTAKICSTRSPTIPTARRGEFGEVMTAALLAEFWAYTIPVHKLRSMITPNQSLPSTDVIAIKWDKKAITEVCFAESKLRTVRDTDAPVQGYKQLLNDYSKEMPDMVIYTLARLYERNDPLFESFSRYAGSPDGAGALETFRLGLWWDPANWSDSSLDAIDEEILDDNPRLSVHLARLPNLRKLSDECFDKIGIKEVLDLD